MSPAIYRTSLSNPSHTYSARNSREHLIPKSPRPRSVRANHVRSSRAPVGKGGAAIEQKRSHGIGGAGNIRMYSILCFTFLSKFMKGSLAHRECRSTFGGHLPFEVGFGRDEEEGNSMVWYVDCSWFETIGKTFNDFGIVW